MFKILHKRYWGTAVLLLLGALLLATPVLAQDTVVTDNEVNEVAKDLFCPVCESTPLDVCPTQACADWRELIREQLAEGQSPEEVQAYFARQYGDGVLANPPKQGFNLILWLLPVVAIVLGGFFFSRYMRTLRTSAAGVAEDLEAEGAEAVQPPIAQDDYKARLEAELRNR
ncbi:cytochrome c-type biogenesis protein [Candidatus Leptofilum sp.]|uniref:cytochrome c-type biogenesis protein n=1 Tax=Candidatus Leptofilum sp. TaxID=3241576 RepID=UPI003B5B0513